MYIMITLLVLLLISLLPIKQKFTPLPSSPKKEPNAVSDFARKADGHMCYLAANDPEILWRSNQSNEDLARLVRRTTKSMLPTISRD